MQDYGDYPETSVAWWEDSDIPAYGREVEEFEWNELTDDDEPVE